VNDAAVAQLGRAPLKGAAEMGNGPQYSATCGLERRQSGRVSGSNPLGGASQSTRTVTGSRGSSGRQGAPIRDPGRAPPLADEQAGEEGTWSSESPPPAEWRVDPDIVLMQGLLLEWMRWGL